VVTYKKRAGSEIMAFEAAKIEDGLIASSDLAGELNHPGPDIKPCIALMLENSYCRGDSPNRNIAALIIACELRRIGLEQDAIEYRIQLWNERNDPPLRRSEFTKAIRNALSGKYDYGCNNINLEPTCIGKDVCPHYKGVRSTRRNYNNRTFIKYHWPQYLSNIAIITYYLTLVEIERRNQVGPGGKIFTSYRQINEISSISHQSIKKALLELERFGLIKLKIGYSQVWLHRGTEIQRIIPIPKPSQEIKQKSKVKNVTTVR